MNIALWIVQGLVALAFLMAGVMKLTQPSEKLLERMEWLEDFSQPTIRLISVAEILGALGVILPAATGILPILTPIAAAGLAIIQFGALATHLRRSEQFAANIVLIVLVAFVAVGRFALVPLA